ncbi:acyl-CoA dehydrogenase family protein [Blastococcus sp. URHD0036]|uniref:acyl-CoA dehydrogenase family protein n=1 Tax=Blastococcus sp. URHD0036 TaxID=1380356 RepID=UPI0004970A14|nr:acyl-CoA dehydrogenase [Blastococcus sp. URHD0036]
MHLELTDEQRSFRDTARRFIESRTPLTTVRDLYDEPDGFDRGWWREAARLGWTSLFVPETHGGGTLSGRAVTDAVVLAEEIGRLVSPGPVLPVNVVAAALAWSGGGDRGTALLPALAAGEAIAGWAFAEPGDRWTPDALETVAVIDDGGVTVEGEKAYVEAAGVADHLLVTARGDGGLTQVLVPADAPGVTVLRGRSVDMTRRYGRVRLTGVRLPVEAVVGQPGRAADVVERQLALALALQCAEMVGLAERAMETTVEYGRDRIAFGRPIVSFQVLKHRLADMAVHLEGMKAVTEELAASIDGKSAETSRLASIAKAYVGRHCLEIVDDCVQITGGMGVTWEHDLHLYNRRAAVDRAMWGTPELHRRRLLDLLADGGRL